MTDKASLLNELKIDRDAEPAPGPKRSWWPWAAIAVLAGIGIAGWRVTAKPDSEPTRAAVPVEPRASRVVPAESSSALDASGYVVARRQATVSAKITGQLTEVLIEEGQRVEAGEVVARLDDSNTRAALDEAEARLAQAQAALSGARTAFEDATPIYSRNREQYEAGVTSAQEHDAAKAAYDAAEADVGVKEQAVAVARAAVALARRNEDDTVVRAPFAGIVTVKAAQAGEIVSPVSAGGGFTRTGVGTIVDMDSLEVEVDVSENFIQRVRPGQPATITLNAYPEWKIPAEVIAIVPTADRAKATVKVRVGFKEKDSRVLPEMGARVSFLAEPVAEEQSRADAAADVADGRPADSSGGDKNETDEGSDSL